MVRDIQRPRVALFSTRFLPYSQTFVFDELRHHDRYEAEVFCLERQNTDTFPHPRVHSLRPASSLGERLEAAVYQRCLYSPRFASLIGRGGYDLVHAHFGTGAQYALPYAAYCDLPLVVTLHGFDVTALATHRRFHPKHWRYALLSPWLLQRTTRVLAASTEMAELIERVGAPRERIHVWRLGVELPPLDHREQPANEVLMVGRFVEKKGFEYGLQAFALLAERFPEMRLVIVGDGELGPRLRELTQRGGIEDRVEFTGVLPHAAVLERVSRCRVLLAPSVTAASGDRESGLIVVKEAAARGVPAVASRHGGIPEIIVDGETGFLVAERDVDTLADRLTRLLGSSELRDRLGVAARRRMESEYEIGARVRELERHYDEARTEHGPR